MVPLFALVVAFLAVGRVLAGDTGETSFPKPLIFHNLTVDEFHAKRWEHRRGALRLGKRVAYLQESKNNADQQAVIEQHVPACHEFFGRTWRPVSGHCHKKQPHRYAISCTDTMEQGRNPKRRQTTLECREKEQVCGIKPVFAYTGKPTRLPYCIDVLPVDNEVATEAEDHEDEWWAEPETKKTKFDGKKTCPDEVYSPGTWDTFWEMAGQAPGSSGAAGALLATFFYNGSKGSDPTFLAQSPKNVKSWCCMDCPSGLLTVETEGLRSEAWGFTVSSFLLD